jgi:hypothetical protein
MNNSDDPFDPTNLVLPKNFLKNREVVTKGRSDGAYQFHQIPVSAVHKLLTVLNSAEPVFTVLLALCELKFNQYEKEKRCKRRAPALLTSRLLKKYGISRKQKRRALQILQRAGLIAVEQGEGKNPLVTMKWD